MNDKGIAKLIMAQVLSRLQATPGLSEVGMARNFQPRQHGRDTGPCVYFFKLGEMRYGHPARRDVYDSAGGVMAHTEAQMCQAMYQFSAWIPQDPADVNALSESDVLITLSSIMQSDSTLASFRTAGVGVQRISEIRNPYMTTDSDQFEAVPNFDVTLTYYRTIVSTLPAVATYEANFNRV